MVAYSWDSSYLSSDLWIAGDVFGVKGQEKGGGVQVETFGLGFFGLLLFVCMCKDLIV